MNKLEEKDWEWEMGIQMDFGGFFHLQNKMEGNYEP